MRLDDERDLDGPVALDVDRPLGWMVTLLDEDGAQTWRGTSTIELAELLDELHSSGRWSV